MTEEKTAPRVRRSWPVAVGVFAAALVMLVPDSAFALPDISPEQPPGTDGFTTLLNWVAWGALICGAAGFLISAAYLGFASLTGREITGFKGLVISIIVCILVTAVGAIMRVFL